MKFIRYGLLYLIGGSAGFATAAAFVAFISMLGIFTKIAAKTRTAKECILYENCLIFGIMLATLFQFFFVFSSAGYATPPFHSIFLGIIFLLLLGLFGGIYVGLLLGGLSEVLNVIPIYTRKTHTQNSIFRIILFLALGKTIFTLLQFLNDQF